MYVITVIPIARGIAKELLTYMSQRRLELGSLIEVPLRRRTIRALVVEVKDARSQKMAIKSSNFMLRKVASLADQNEKAFLPPELMNIVGEMSDHYASTLGAILYGLINKNIFNEQDLSFLPRKSTEKKSSASAIEGPYDFRMNEYEEIFQKNLKAKKTTIILFPTIDSLNKAQSSVIQKDFKATTIAFHGKTTPKAFRKNIERLKSGDPHIILMTGTFLFLIPESAATLIIEEEHSRWYKMRNRPFVDFSFVGTRIASLYGLELILGDIVLSTKATEETKDITRSKKRNLETRILFAKKDPENKDLEPFEPIDKEMLVEIERTLSKKGSIFIWVTRKGYAPIVLCEHCGAIVKCENCDAPVVLYKKEPENYFLCHHCGTKRSALEACRNCGSWKLGSFGIGIDRVTEEIKKKWPKEHNMGLIEIGTEKSVTDMTGAYDLTLIPSIDSLLSLPDFSIDEQIFRTVLLLKERTKKQIILKTRHQDLELIDHIKKEDLKAFRNEMTEKRKQFKYPPFATFIKITLRGNKDKIGKEVAEIQKDLAQWKPSVFPAFIKTIKNQFIMHVLIKVERSSWPQADLLEYLRALPPSTEINVDPQSLL